MIIKKKYTTVKKILEEKQVEETPVVIDDIVEEIKQEKDETKEIKEVSIDDKKEEKQEEKPVPEVKKKKKNTDLDLSLENIQFEQREERREGTRRRGYRRTQDRNIVSRAQKDAESIKDVAKKEGYQAGIELAQKDLEDLKSKFAEFFNYKEEVYEKVSECILDIAVEISRKIINKNIETDREYILPIIKGVVEEVNKTENKITLKVMPKDVEIVRDKVSEIFSGNYFEAKISVVPDNDIKDGGVIVETSNGLIDASISTQLTIIEKALKKQEEV